MKNPNYNKSGYLTLSGFNQLYQGLLIKLNTTHFSSDDFGKGASSRGLITETFSKDENVKAFISAYENDNNKTTGTIDYGNRLYSLKNKFKPTDGQPEEYQRVKLFTVLVLWQLVKPGISVDELISQGYWMWEKEQRLNAGPGRLPLPIKGERSSADYHYYIGLYLSFLSGGVRFFKFAVTKKSDNGVFYVKEKGLHHIAEKEDNPGYFGRATSSLDGYFFASLEDQHNNLYQMNMIWKNEISDGQTFGDVSQFRASIQGISSDGGRLLNLEAIMVQISHEERIRMREMNFQPKSLKVFQGNKKYKNICFYLMLQHRLFAGSSKPIANLDTLSAKDNNLSDYDDLLGSYRFIQQDGDVFIQGKIEINRNGQTLLHTQIKKRGTYDERTFYCSLSTGGRRYPILCLSIFHKESMNHFGFLVLEFDVILEKKYYRASFLSIGLDASGSMCEHVLFVKDNTDFNSKFIYRIEQYENDKKLKELHDAYLRFKRTDP